LCKYLHIKYILNLKALMQLTIMLPSAGNFHYFQFVLTKFGSSGRHYGATIRKNLEKKIIHSFGIYYSLVCVFLFTRLWFLIHLLNLNLAPTCKTDYLVFLCCLHRQIRYDEFNSNTINLHFFFKFLSFYEVPLVS
jgi:hypothetical protein